MGKMDHAELDWVAHIAAEAEAQAGDKGVEVKSEAVLTPEQKAVKVEEAQAEQQSILALETEKKVLEAEIASDRQKQAKALGSIAGFVGMMSNMANSPEVNADIIERRKEAETFARELEQRIADNELKITEMGLEARKARYRMAFPDGPEI